jgi:RNA polymerase sigma-70 factor (ECF subfamily)
MELLQRFARGDLDAFETIFRERQHEVYGWIMRIVRDPSIAEDLTIETFWRMYRARARFDPDGNLGGWARRIATNVALDHLRRRKIEVELPATLSAKENPDPLVSDEVQRRIQKAFQQLPAKLQVTASLVLIEELSYKEVAEALGISIGAVKVRIFRAVRLLRKKLAGLVNDNDRSGKNSATSEKRISAHRG